MTRTPHWKYQNIIVTLSSFLNQWSQMGFVVTSPGIIPSQENSVIPDMVWVSKKRLVQIEDEAGHFIGFSELVVEVLSAGERNIYRDKQAKLKLYSQGNVQEYWVVDHFNQQVKFTVQIRDNSLSNFV